MSLRPSTQTEVRKKGYKSGVDAGEARQRREDNLMEIRKNKREDNLLKKRLEGLLLQSQSLLDASPNVDATIEKKVPTRFLICICIDLCFMGFLWKLIQSLFCDNYDDYYYNFFFKVL
ncbi:hypothetical protein Pint_29922 [Pistacia integerrima]|uniref:Uncharacterized protein n=1 Tax=Pistacia integerrima TaxID=434235 RepID=A0ACC0X0A3_9ROSI|nr:hypothetical protein Pint_29922 [Pistacia integerrima]